MSAARRGALIVPVLVGLLGLLGCQGAVGTVELELVGAPGSTLLDQVQKIRLTLGSPEKVVEAERVGNSFELEFEVEAGGQNSVILFEGFAADGSRIASGRSAPLPVAAIDATVRIFVAPPVSLREAPASLSRARSEFGASRLSFGSIYAGGRYADGELSDLLEIYNVYDHEVQAGASLPDPRAGQSVMAGTFGLVWVFGGEGSAGDASHELLLFDTNVAPNGAYSVARSDAALARSHAFAVAIDSDAFAVFGDPMVLVDGSRGSASAWPDAPVLEGRAVSVRHEGLPQTLVVGAGAGPTGATLIEQLALTELPAPTELLRTNHSTVLLADADALVLGGRTTSGPVASAVRFDFGSREFTVIEGLLVTPREDAAIASTAEYIVVAGGTDGDGQVLSSAEIIDAGTLVHLKTVPMIVPRTGADAQALANGQIIIVGGLDANGAPTAVIELFTP